MAVTKIWAIKDSLQRVLDYAANPDKTEYDALAQTLHYAENDAKTKLNESAQLVTGIHCRVDHAWEDMRAVQERFGKTDGVVALHAYQSFREGEVTPEQCHEIGVALARKVWGKRFQVLVATHMNTDNLHNHFVINSVSYVDGKKYEQRRSQYAEFRAASDKLCREYGLSVVEQPKAKTALRGFMWRDRLNIIPVFKGLSNINVFLVNEVFVRQRLLVAMACWQLDRSCAAALLCVILREPRRIRASARCSCAT